MRDDTLAPDSIDGSILRNARASLRSVDALLFTDPDQATLGGKLRDLKMFHVKHPPSFGQRLDLKGRRLALHRDKNAT